MVGRGLSVSLAPREGRTKTRLTWLLRQLGTDDLPHGLRVRVDWNKRGLYSEALVDALQDGHMPLMVSSDRVAIPGDAQPRWRKAAPIVEKCGDNCYAPTSDGEFRQLRSRHWRSRVRYRDLSWRGRNLGELVAKLTRGKQRSDYRAHLDPDLEAGHLAKKARLVSNARSDWKRTGAPPKTGCWARRFVPILGIISASR